MICKFQTIRFSSGAPSLMGEWDKLQVRCRCKRGIAALPGVGFEFVPLSWGEVIGWESKWGRLVDVDGQFVADQWPGAVGVLVADDGGAGG
jgi:hypothetical protein